MLAFEIQGAGEAETFRFLNAVRLIKLAVSLGGTESLIEHPASMTHADVPKEEQLGLGITPGLVRLSVGVEHPEDLIADLAFALSQVEAGRETMEGEAESILAHAAAEEI
jgi:methionine-gamma-lyase